MYGSRTRRPDSRHPVVLSKGYGSRLASGRAGREVWSADVPSDGCAGPAKAVGVERQRDPMTLTGSTVTIPQPSGTGPPFRLDAGRAARRRARARRRPGRAAPTRRAATAGRDAIAAAKLADEPADAELPAPRNRRPRRVPNTRPALIVLLVPALAESSREAPADDRVLGGGNVIESEPARCRRDNSP